MNTSSSSSLHPLFWIAGVSVTLLSVVGIASLTGVLPSKSAAPTEPSAIVATPTAAVAAAPVPPAAPPETVKAAVATAPAAPFPAHKTAARHKASNTSPTPLAALPPAQGAGIPPDYVPQQVSPAIPACANCGVISNIREITHEGQGSGLGAIAGGVLGGALANNIGQGNGRTLATIAGAVGGGLLGNKLEKDQHKERLYQISVRLEDGSTQIIDAASLPSWRIGDPVKIVNGSITSR